ncbi:MAG: SGNH/GDSL hydrolase family protein [Deltaproteobacteria bacterium]|nr:SGNH/GDSL hydrolase family protein [Myxococcales bacterium]MDP3213105.1 SGNH/GDSL hydrolase family protein [Deltaproteobacteria bacterium]
MRRLLVAVLPFSLAACLSSPDDARPLPSGRASDAGADAVDAADVAPRADAAVTLDAPLDAPPDAPPASLRVLFVGNSYTFYNDLPALIARMGAAAARAGRGPEIAVDTVTVGGASMRNHWDTGTAPARIMVGSWDAVVLQGQSVEPVLNPSEFRTYSLRLGGLASTHGARPVFFATWPRRAGDALYAQPWSGGTPQGFNTRMHAAYSEVAAMTSGGLAAVGNAWMRALDARPTIDLYDPDGSHPSAAGSWLAACVLYRALTDTPAPAETETAVTSLPLADVGFLRGISAAP